MSYSVEYFHRNLHRNINLSVIEKIEFITRGQSSNENYVNLWQLFKKISSLVFTNPNIPALNYDHLWKKI